MRRSSIVPLVATAMLAVALRAEAQWPPGGESSGPNRGAPGTALGVSGMEPPAQFAGDPQAAPAAQFASLAPADPSGAPAANLAEADRIARLEKQIDLQQKQMQVLEKMIEVMGEQAKTSPAAPGGVEDLRMKETMLDARSQQAARRDQEVADQIDGINERRDAQGRYEPSLPAPLKELFLPSGTIESPLTINGQFRFFYSEVEAQRGVFDVPFFSPYFLLQLNPDWLLLASMDIGGDGSVSLGEAQFNWFVNDWLTVVGGRYITPIGFFNERINHEWINRLPDEPLMFLQVSPQITTDGVEVRGSSYLFGSPVKMEYMFYGGNGFRLQPGSPPGLTDVADLEAISGGTDSLDLNAIGGRLGLWIPELGLTGGFSGYHNSHYLVGSSDYMQVWQTDIEWRKGNWDIRSEYAHNFQQAADIPGVGQNIHRDGVYSQVAYRPYDAANSFLSKTEFVYRFSATRFQGLDPAAVAAALPNTVDAPVDRNQHTIGVNYWFHHAMVLKFAYEINQELHGLNFRDNTFMSQFVWAF